MHDWTFRPWGQFRVIMTGHNFIVKHLTILPNCRTSLQSHKNRSENWIIVSGEPTIVNVDNYEFSRGLGKTGETYKKGDSIRIPQGNIHRICAGENTVQIIETWMNETDMTDYKALTEEDIIRYEDDYGR